ncbi:hypothetical protein HK105_201356 [Polyrhizophydium stewartii]|uniref:Uncharacterized protein n=1 Tax=Polyrhizophydium stewartii TaxID=2732419 RepID=A0ABR4NHT5_9FUNG
MLIERLLVTQLLRLLVSGALGDESQFTVETAAECPRADARLGDQLCLRIEARTAPSTPADMEL